MGKRKKSSRKPQGPKKRDPLETIFTCLYCHHEKSVTCKIDRREGLAHLHCKVCGQMFQGRVHHLTEPIDIYSMWIDAADQAEKTHAATQSTSGTSSRRPQVVLETPEEDGSDED